MIKLSFYERWLGRVYRKIYSPMVSFMLRRMGVVVGRNVIFYGRPSIQLSVGSQIIIGDGCVLCSHPAFTAMGVTRQVTLRTLLPGSKLILGRNVGLSGSVICAALSLEIEDDCLLGSGCQIVDTDFHPIQAEGRREAPITNATHKKIHIQRNAFIGAGAFIGKGVFVGQDAVIGAMSVVTKDVLPRSIVAGNPAVTIRRIDK